MRVLVMDVRRVRMGMLQDLMDMGVAVRHCIVGMGMVMMPILVAVAVLMLHPFVFVWMAVLLKGGQVGASQHQHQAQDKRKVQWLAEDHQGKPHADEWRDGIIRAC